MSPSKTGKLADCIASQQKTVIFTGAGISTESGIPDFRSPGGIWDQFDPEEMTYQNFMADEKNRRKYWAFHHQSWRNIRDARPNPAHRAVRQLEDHCDISAVITQNIDGLHRKAGTDPERLLELHGTMWRADCLSCGETHPCEQAFDQIDSGISVPRCPVCEGDLKPGTVAFGEPLPKNVMVRAQKAAVSCEVFIAVGSSLTVYPAAFLPEMAVNAGANVAIINRDPTPLDSMAHLVSHGKAGEILPEVVRHLDEQQRHPRPGC